MIKLTMLLKRIWSWIAGSKIVQYTILLVLAFIAGKRSAKREQKVKQLETQEKINEKTRKNEEIISNAGTSKRNRWLLPPSER